jgi:hypothetical protein
MTFRAPLALGLVLALGFLTACGNSSSGSPGADAATHDGNTTTPEEDGESSSSPDGSVYEASTAPDGASSSGGGNSDASGGSSPDAGPTVGATTTFTSYEGEDGTPGGGATVMNLTSPPTTSMYSSALLEASGHAYMNLASTGQYVEWTNKTGHNITYINVRYSIPDAPNGGGIQSTLDLYVNGTMRQVLPVNSMQTWIYEGGSDCPNSGGGTGTNYQYNCKIPSYGDPRAFWDEVNTFITGAAVAPGDTIRLQKDASNDAGYYNIDVIDIEAPPPALMAPANSISIETCGAVADNNPTNGAADPGATDSTQAIQNCINMAQSSKQTLWIPKGTYYLKGSQGLQANGITIAGAGIWYSIIYRDVPLPNNVGLAATFSVTSCTVQNFATDANATSRATIDGCGGAMDTTGTNWVADTIWTKHAESGFWASGSGGTLKNNRLGPMWADGINLNNVSLTGTEGTNLTAQNNFVRGTGDDAIAINSVNYNGSQMYTPMSGAQILNNTSITPWGGKGVAIYGGSAHVVKNNYMSDTARYIGLGVGKFGTNGSDLTSATVSGNVVVRCGGNAYVQGQPAMQIGNGGDGQGVGNVGGATISNNTIKDALYSAVAFSTVSPTSNPVIFENNLIQSPGLDGIIINGPFYPATTGAATFTDNTVTGLNTGQMAFVNDNASGFMVTRMGNSWQ